MNKRGESRSRPGIWLAVPLAALALVSCSTARVVDIYDLGAPAQISGLKANTRSQILVQEPSALKSLDAQDIVVKTSPTQIEYLARSQWPDRLPKVVQARLVEAFENTNRVRAVSKPGEGLVIDYQIVTDIRAFQANVGGGGQAAQVSLSVKLVSDRTGKVLRAKVFDAQAPLGGTDAPSVVEGINAAFDSVARDVVKWVLAAV
ncbi:MAG: ABC-type transport auxiliary lipoprotein family protein [Nitratireductor sp.]|nr:ABC-type transport auxiliary lipoprotein family protein [Nitratireductor sp.]